MLKKLQNPKILGQITIICFSIMLILYIKAIDRNFIYILISLILTPLSYIIIYLLLIIFKKKKNIRTLNIFLAIVLTILIILSLTILRHFNIIWFMHNQSLISIICFLILYSLLITTIFGIIYKKKWPYNIFMYVQLTLITINVLGSFNYIFNLPFLLYHIGIISFIVFLYMYGKSIEKGAKDNGK